MSIFKKNKCPDFYPCNDGTFSTNNSKGACTKHGGLKRTVKPATKPIKAKISKEKSKKVLVVQKEKKSAKKPIKQASVKTDVKKTVKPARPNYDYGKKLEYRTLIGNTYLIDKKPYFITASNPVQAIPIDEKGKLSPSNRTFEKSELKNIQDVPELKKPSFNKEIGWFSEKLQKIDIGQAVRIAKFKYKNYKNKAFNQNFTIRDYVKNIKPIINFDDIREFTYYVNVDDKVTYTDAHVLLTLTNWSEIADGKYNVNNFSPADSENNFTYPNYKAVIPDYIGGTKLDIPNLLNYLNLIEKAKLWNPTTKQIACICKDQNNNNIVIGINGKLLSNLLKTLINFGNIDNYWFYADTPNKAFLIRNDVIGLTALIMPIMLHDDYKKNYAGTGDMDRKIETTFFYNIAENRLINNQDRTLKNVTPTFIAGINAIYKNNKCPDFYPCNDGTFSTNNSKGACTKHGGLKRTVKPATKPEKAKKTIKKTVKKVYPPKSIIKKEVEKILPDADGNYCIHFLNKDKNFKEDVVCFKYFDDAEKWGNQNLGNFNLDMIRIRKKPIIEKPEFSNYTLENYTHTKTGQEKILVKPKKTVSRNIFINLKTLAKKYSGFYSRYAKGFLFKNESDAKSFINNQDNIEDIKPIPAKKSAKKSAKFYPPYLKKYTDKQKEELIEQGEKVEQLIINESSKDQIAYLKNPLFFESFLVYRTKANEIQRKEEDKKSMYRCQLGDYQSRIFNYNKTVLKFVVSKMLPFILPDFVKRKTISMSGYSSFNVNLTLPSKYAQDNVTQDKIKNDVRSLLGKFVRDCSDTMTDYFDRNYYFDVNLKFESESNRNEKNKMGGEYGYYFESKKKPQGYYLKQKQYDMSHRGGTIYWPRTFKSQESANKFFDKNKFNKDNINLKYGYGGNYSLYKTALSKDDFEIKKGKDDYIGYINKLRK